MTLPALTLAILCLNPVEDVVRDRVDAMEVNHFYNEWGHHIHDQVVFWEWGPDGRWQPRGYRAIRCPHTIPQKDWERGTYHITWLDNWRTLRRVDADFVMETWTQVDPEVATTGPRCRALSPHPIQELPR